MQNSLVSVIIPMYNSEKTILRAIDSVINQTAKTAIEIIITNDGSTDNSLSLIEKYEFKHPNVNLKIINQNNGGVSKARNSSMRCAKGEFIAFLDSDDVWYKQKLEKQLKILNEHQNIDFLATGFDGMYFNRKKEFELIKINIIDLIYKNYFQPSTVIMRRHVLDEVGYFDESQKYAEEGNYFIRIANKFSCYFLNVKLINYGDGKSGFGESGLSSNIKEMHKGFLKNLKYALDNNYITYVDYIKALLIAELKYFRRKILIKLRK